MTSTLRDRCPACGSADLATAFTRAEWSAAAPDMRRNDEAAMWTDPDLAFGAILRCRACGTVCTDRVPTPAALSRFYGAYRSNISYLAKLDKKLARDMRRLAWLSVVARFETLEFALFTSFNFNPDFFEQNVLPTLFGLDLADKASPRANEQHVHKQLMHCRVAVAYDPAVAEAGAGRFRYSACPVYLGGQRRFHPKMIVLGGTVKDKDAKGRETSVQWLYLAVTSANLTLAGWGRNCEGFADVWLHARAEKPSSDLEGFLRWLIPRADGPDGVFAQAVSFFEGLQQTRTKINPEGIWREQPAMRLYAAPQHASLWSFLGNAYGRPRVVRAGSPYWGEASRIAAALQDVELHLIAAIKHNDSQKTNLGHDTLAQLNLPLANVKRWCNDKERFFHIKLYGVETTRTNIVGAGSCNFTEAGQFWKDPQGLEAGNVEAMLFDTMEMAKMAWPSQERLSPEALAEASAAEDEAPPAWPVYVHVMYDWKSKRYLWRLEGEPRNLDVQLQLPDAGPGIVIDASRTGARTGILLTRRFSFTWNETLYYGIVCETNLSCSDFAYGDCLAPQTILESWYANGAAYSGGCAQSVQRRGHPFQYSQALE